MMVFRNQWGAAGASTDQQRADLFRVTVVLPPQLQLQAGSGANVWDKEIGWAISKFNFPDRGVDQIAIKHGQHTNYQIGADKPVGEISMTARYAFNQRTAELLERWYNVTSNRKIGAVALTSAVSTEGTFYWLTPNLDALSNPSAAEKDAYKLIRAYRLIGCWLSGLTPSAADAESTSGLVTYDIKMTCNDYYPFSPTDLHNATIPFNLGGA